MKFIIVTGLSGAGRHRWSRLLRIWAAFVLTICRPTEYPSLPRSLQKVQRPTSVQRSSAISAAEICLANSRKV